MYIWATEARGRAALVEKHAVVSSCHTGDSWAPPSSLAHIQSCARNYGPFAFRVRPQDSTGPFAVRRGTLIPSALPPLPYVTPAPAPSTRGLSCVCVRDGVYFFVYFLLAIVAACDEPRKHGAPRCRACHCTLCCCRPWMRRA